MGCGGRAKIKDKYRPSKVLSTPELNRTKVPELVASTPISMKTWHTSTLKTYSPDLNKGKTRRKLRGKWRDLQRIFTQQQPQEEVKETNMVKLIDSSKAKSTKQRTDPFDRVKFAELPRYMKPKHTRMHMKAKFSTWDQNK